MMKKVVLLVMMALIFSGFSETAAVEPDNNTVDGNATYFSIGTIVPSKVEYVGYDARAQEMYLNITIASSDETTSLPASVPYSINVLNNSGEPLIGDPLIRTLSPTTGDIIINDQNVKLQLVNPLVKDHRVVVEVDTD